MSLPISIRGEVVGTLDAAPPENTTFTDGDRVIMRAVADRVAIAIENARLFEETEQALDETQRLYAASRSVTTAADVSAVYQSVASHLATAGANIHRVSILLAQPSPTAEAPYVEYAHIWTRTPSELQEGDQIPRDVVSFPELLRAGSGMALIDDVKTVENEALKTLLLQSGSDSAVLVAIQSRLRWYGLLVCESPQPSAFNESYVNFMRAIADQVAIAVESLLSFEEAQLQAQRALALAEAGQLASQMSLEFNSSLDEVFTRVAKPAQL